MAGARRIAAMNLARSHELGFEAIARINLFDDTGDSIMRSRTSCEMRSMWTRPRRFAIISSLVLIVVAGADWRSVSAQEGFAADALATPLSIHQVISGGYWSKSDDEGFYRVLVVAGGAEHVVHRLFLQWVKVPPDPEPYEMVRSTEVSELSAGQGYVFKVRAEFPGLKHMKLSIDARHRSGKTVHFTVVANSDRTYGIQRRK